MCRYAWSTGSHELSSFTDHSSKCAICASKSELQWVVNPMVLLRWDWVVNQVVNRGLTLKQMWMCPGIQIEDWVKRQSLSADCSSECAICASKSEWRWVVNSMILLRWDQVVNQVVNRWLMLKRTQMRPGIQEPRERTELWRDNPYLWIVPADIDCSKFYLQIVPANEGSKEEGGKENVLMSSGHCH